MLNLKFALNLEHLADEMIEEIKKCWTTPFEAPVVIFPDPKLEQWFRLHWLKKNGTIAGFNSKMIDKFLMEILVDENEQKQKLSIEMLRNVILAYIYQHKNSLEEIDSTGEIARYLLNEGPEKSKTIDENRLFDFASKMATLFLDYETSRPENFLVQNGTSKPGILECWKQDDLKDFFGPKAHASELWQRKLYSMIFHKKNGENSLLEKVFNQVNEKRNEGKKHPKKIEFLTLPFLYKACKEFNCKKFTGTNGILPVFIFGLSGMGQFYRVILENFAKQHDVFAYIQNPCMEFWEDLSKSRKKIYQWNKKNNKWFIGNYKENSSKEVDPQIQKKLSLDNFKEDREPDVNSSNENALLCYWGKSGRDNIKLWCSASNYNFEFAEQKVELPENPTLLQVIQNMVAERKNDSQELLKMFEATLAKTGSLANDKSFSLTGAPTKIREMEVLHSRICNLIKEGAHVSDILVVSPNLDEYRTAIFQIFDQNQKDNGLHVPFCIVDSPAKNSLVGSALNAIFNILDKQTISRPDFFSLMRNPVVQVARNLTDDEVDSWNEWVENINVYRDREIYESETGYLKEDWKNAVRRLLLSRFTNSSIQYDDENELLPYADINTSNNSSLLKFIEAVDALENIIDFKKHNSSISPEKLDEFANLIEEFLSMPSPPEDFIGENVIYQDVISSFNNLRCQYYAGLKGISWECLKYTLCGTAQSSEYSCGGLFVHGITFSKFIPNRIIPIKHLFFIGADSKSFPGTKPSAMMDLRSLDSAWPGDDTPMAKRRYAFLCQFMSTSCGFHISYVSKDIVKDEDYYPSSIVNDIRSFFKNSIKATIGDSAFSEWICDDVRKDALKNIWPETNISLDENRPYSELFSERELRNKSLLNENKNDISSNNDKNTKLKKVTTINSSEAPDFVTISMLKKFLEDPFQFHISQMMQKGDNPNSVDSEDIYFEPVDFSALDNSILTKKMVTAKISPEGENDLEEFLQDMELKGAFPDGVYKEKLLADTKARADKILKQMQESENKESSPLLDQKSWTFQHKIEDLKLESLGKKFVIKAASDFFNGECLVDITTKEIGSPTKDPYFEKDKYLGLYLQALTIIAHNNSQETQNINIAIYSSSSKAIKPALAKVSTTANEAKKILSTIYRLAFQDGKTGFESTDSNISTTPYAKCIPINMLDNPPTDFYDFCKKLKREWEYFSKGDLFDKGKDLGFSSGKSFKEEWDTASKQQSDLLTPLSHAKKKNSKK